MNNFTKSIIKKLIIGLGITFLFTIGLYSAGRSNTAVWIILAGALLSILTSKAYLLPFAGMKTAGTVTSVNIEPCFTRSMRGGANRRTSRQGIAFSTNSEYEIAVTIQTDKGKTIHKTFPYIGDAQHLFVGTKISYTVLDEIPTIVEQIKDKNPSNWK